MVRISLTTSPIFCAACDSAVICALVPCASLTAARTISVVIASWRLISPIELLNSSAATAAVSTLLLASLEADTALSARCEVWPELVSSVLAVERMAIAPSVTVRRCSSTRWRKAAIACSMMERRSCCSCIEARSRSASRRSVMSSWVATQPPSAIGRLMTATTRPLADLTSAVVVLPCAMAATSPCRYSSGSREKLPLAMRNSSRLASVRPGFTTSSGSWYRSM